MYTRGIEMIIKLKEFDVLTLTKIRLQSKNDNANHDLLEYPERERERGYNLGTHGNG